MDTVVGPSTSAGLAVFYLVILSLFAHTGYSQDPALDPDDKRAEQKLREYFSHASEEIPNRLLRYSGIWVTIPDNPDSQPTNKEVVGIVARLSNEMLLYCAYGDRMPSNPQLLNVVHWHEMFRYGDKEKRRTAMGDYRNQRAETVVKDGTELPYYYPVLDPFGMALCTSGGIVSEHSKTDEIAERFLKSQFLGSRMDERNLVGVWKWLDGSGITTVSFDSKFDFRPVQVEFRKIDTETNSLQKVFSTNRIFWKRNSADELELKRLEQSEYQEQNHRQVELSFDIDWTQGTKWKDNKIDWRDVFDGDPMNWRTTALTFFDKAIKVDAK